VRLTNRAALVLCERSGGPCTFLNVYVAAGQAALRWIKLNSLLVSFTPRTRICISASFDGDCCLVHLPSVFLLAVSQPQDVGDDAVGIVIFDHKIWRRSVRCSTLLEAQSLSFLVCLQFLQKSAQTHSSSSPFPFQLGDARRLALALHSQSEHPLQWERLGRLR